VSADNALSLGEWAVGYARRGFAVFPCEPRGKQPLGRLVRNGVKAATKDEDVVRRWWLAEPDANIGLATGEPCGFFVVDLDSADAERAYAELFQNQTPPTAQVTTSRGRHLWYRMPAGVVVKNSASKLLNKLDIRSTGGYVLAPPSIHPSGAVYSWTKVER